MAVSEYWNGAPPLASRGRPPAILQKCLVKPDRQTTPAHQGTIILGPVRYPILDFLGGGFRGHDGFSIPGFLNHFDYPRSYLCTNAGRNQTNGYLEKPLVTGGK